MCPTLTSSCRLLHLGLGSGLAPGQSQHLPWTIAAILPKMVSLMDCGLLSQPTTLWRKENERLGVVNLCLSCGERVETTCGDGCACRHAPSHQRANFASRCSRFAAPRLAGPKAKKKKEKAKRKLGFFISLSLCLRSSDSNDHRERSAQKKALANIGPFQLSPSSIFLLELRADSTSTE